MAIETVLKPPKKERSIYTDLLIMLILPCVMACYYYGRRVIFLVLICMLTGVVCETVGAALMRCPRELQDCSSLFIGGAMVLMLPADIPVWIPVAGTAFAVLAVKLPLGGSRSAPFVPAAAGFSFMCLCWNDRVFTYPAIDTGFEYVQGTSLAKMLSLNTSIRPNTINVFDVLTGNFPGPSGATCIIVLLGSLAYLGFRHRQAIINSLGFIAGCAAMALLFPRIYAEYARLTSLMMELCSGLLVFSALFFLPDPATSPNRPLYRFIYGTLTGIICMVLRYFGKFEESVCFVVLLMNGAWPAIESKLERQELKRRKKKQLKERMAAHAPQKASGKAVPGDG